MDQLRWKVLDVVPETDDAATFFLENESGSAVRYQAGQFLTLLFQHHGLDIRRSYSLSSTPGIDRHCSITVKRKPNGEISRFLLDRVKPGDALVSLQPAGRFTVETDPALQRRFFFIAAGSGIVPVFSLLKKILAEEPLAEIVLIYQNHDERHIIFREELEKMSEANRSRFNYIRLLSAPRDHTKSPLRLTNFLLEQFVSLLVSPEKETLFYLCGPLPFMRMAQFTLRLLGFSEEQIRKEIFTVDFIPPPPLMTDYGARQVIIHFQGRTHAIQTSYPKNILQTALDHHIQLPYSCRSGRCSTCMARCVRGTVLMSMNEVLTDRDLEEGLVLTCVGYAATDVELQF